MESSGDRLIMLFFDWEKAFDKIDHEELIKAIERFKLPEQVIRVIRSFYENQRFFIEDKVGNSEKKQNTGIRQGCPLSPYLFVLVMTVMTHDVHEKIKHEINQEEYDFLNFWELFYADDTFILGLS